MLGQYRWLTSREGDEPDIAGLKKAESALSAAVDLRHGAERGRTLATLSRVQLALHRADELDAEIPKATAKESMSAR